MILNELDKALEAYESWTRDEPKDILERQERTRWALSKSPLFEPLT